jgi:hypothetical protein
MLIHNGFIELVSTNNDRLSSTFQLTDDAMWMIDHFESGNSLEPYFLD